MTTKPSSALARNNSIEVPTVVRRPSLCLLEKSSGDFTFQDRSHCMYLSQISCKPKTPQVLSVLINTFILNLLTCLGKITIGWYLGLLSVLTDGVHSLSDALINVIGFVSVKLAGKPPTPRYPYGYEKFETVAALIVGSMIFVLFLEILKMSTEKLFCPKPTDVTPFAYCVMLVAIVLNLITSIYEGRMGHKLESEFLIADAKETASDVWVSTSIIVALLLASQGNIWAEGVIGIIMSGVVLNNSVSIFRSNVGILADEAVLNPREVAQLLLTHPQVTSCYAVRSRGKPNAVFADLHLGVDGNVTVEEAYGKISREVNALLSNKYPSIRSVMMHIEPHDQAAPSNSSKAAVALGCGHVVGGGYFKNDSSENNRVD